MKVIYFLITLLITGCSESIVSFNVSQYGEKLPGGYRILTYYALPKTELKIRVPVSESQLIPGILTTDSQDSCLAGILKERFNWEASLPPEERYGLDDRIEISTRAIPDPEKYYALAYKQNRAISKDLDLALSEDGLIQSGQFAQESAMLDLAGKSLEILSSAVGAVAGLGVSDVRDTGQAGCAVEDIQNQRAKELVEMAVNLLNTRYGLIAGPTNSVNNPEIIKFHLNEIDRQLGLIRDALVGTISKKQYIITIIVDPEKDFDRIDLMSVNPGKGIVTDRNEFGVLSEELSTADGSGARTLSLHARKISGHRMESPAASNNASVKPVNEGGVSGSGAGAFLYYNLAQRYELWLTYGGKPIPTYKHPGTDPGSDVFSIYFPQLGRVSALPGDFQHANVEYYEDTGSLKSVSFTRSAEIDAGRLESFYYAADSLYRTLRRAGNDTGTSGITGGKTVETINEQEVRIVIDE